MLRILLLLVFISFPSLAEEVTVPESSGQPIPRFVSLASDKVFVRTGPALRYPIKWVFQKEGMPVEVVQEFDTWRKVRDVNGDEGWIHQTLLRGKRSVLIRAEEPVDMFSKDGGEGKIMAKAEPMVVASLETCSGEWCRIAVDGYSGWSRRNFLWGIYEGETFE